MSYLYTYKISLNSHVAHGVISDPTVGNATLSPVLSNTVPNGSMIL